MTGRPTGFRLDTRFTMPAILVVMVLLFFAIQPALLSPGNLENVGRQAAIVAILACGQLFVVLSGGIDLSLGSIIGLTSVIAAKIVLEWGLGWGFAAALAVGLLLGTANGVFVAYFRMPAMIVTLAMLYFARGAALIIAGGMPVERLPASFSVIGKGSLLGIPNPVFIAGVVLLVGWFCLRYTRTGRAVFAVGGAEETSYLAGIRVQRIKIAAFAISGALAGLASIVLSSRLSSGQPNLGDGLEFQSIAAVVLGGARLGGGKGSVSGALLGVVFLAFLANGLNLARVSSFTQMIVIGCVLIVAMIVDRLRAPAARMI